MEWLELAPGSSSGDTLLGEQLAAQHRVSAARFGWHRDNTIGSTPQPNAWSEGWVEFLRQRRLGFQLELAASKLRTTSRSSVRADMRLLERGRLLCESLDVLFEGYRPVPSLLHGDLWSGNYGTAADGQPVIFDPAVYFGDREAELAMTRLFGGFTAAFYSAYEASWPVDNGARVRTTLYNLYHVLNHFNVFGGAYRQQAASMIDELLAEIGH
jgi:fructosamine-3-kinase